MVTTVKLQNAFEYSWWVGAIAFILLLVSLGVIIFTIVRMLSLREKKLQNRPAYRKIVMTPDVLIRVKNQYSQKVQNIANKYSGGFISKRDGYQELSSVIREFVHEVTGINVENFTVSEVKAMGIKKLDVLMEEYYVPEFAEDEKAEGKDLLASCNTAVGVIRSWS